MAEERVKSVKKTYYVPYNISYGSSLSRFFHETKVNKRIMGAKCPKCGKVIVPPVMFCGRCYVDTESEWIVMPETGTLESFTIVNLTFPGQPKEPPYAYGMIKLDGANTEFPHIIGEIPLEEIKVGMRVKIVWNETRNGDLYDIKYFKPI